MFGPTSTRAAIRLAKRTWKHGTLLALLAAIIQMAGAASAGAATTQAEPQLAIDADASNGSGPCSPIDRSAGLETGHTLEAAVCLVNGDGVAVAAFNYRLTYDDTLLRAPEVADAGNALDDNPDANAGSTTFSRPDLGDGWDCSAGVGAFPMGDEDGIEGNGTGVVYSGGCGSAAGPNTLIAGPLQVIRFIGAAPGTAILSLTRAAVTDDTLDEIGSCRPAIDREIACPDATIEVSGAPVTVVATPPGVGATPGTTTLASGSTPSPSEGAVEGAVDSSTPGSGAAAGLTAAANASAAGSSPSATGTPGARSTVGAAGRQPAAQPTSTRTSSSGGGGANWPLVGVLAGVAALAAAAGVGVWLRARRQR